MIQAHQSIKYIVFLNRDRLTFRFFLFYLVHEIRESKFAKQTINGAANTVTLVLEKRAIYPIHFHCKVRF